MALTNGSTFCYKWYKKIGLKLLCTQILLTEGNAAENFKFIKRSLLEETGLIFMVLTQMRQELQVKHQKPNEKSLLGSLLTKLYLNL